MMSEFNFNIPMGFRFDPTDEELLKFLILQMNGGPLPWNGVVYKDLYGPNAAPWVVFTDGTAHCYWHIKNEGGATKATTFVFTRLIRVSNSKRISRIAGGGTWSGQTGPKKIFSSDTGEAIGVMRMLSFEHPDSDGASPEFGHWIMHEYSVNESTNGAAADLVVCKITRSVKNNSGRRSRRQPPPPLFSSPMIANGGISESIQIPASKRAAEECSFQERKVQKLCGDGFAAEAKPPPQYSSPAIACAEDEMISCKEEKPGDGVGTFSEALQQDGNTAEAAAAIAEDDDHWLVKALLQDGNTEPPYGVTADADEGIDELLRGGRDTAEAAAFREGELDESSVFEDLNNNYVTIASSPAIACVGDVTTSWQEEKPSDGVGTFSEVAAPTLVEALQRDENTERPYGGSAEAAAIAEDDDYWPVKALLQDGNTEPPYGGTAEADKGIDELLRGSSGGGCDTAEGAAFPEGELDESSWRSDFNDFDIGFDVDSLLDDPLQVSPPSPHDYDFNIDVDSRFDDAAQVEPPSLWSYRL